MNDNVIDFGEAKLLKHLKGLSPEGLYETLADPKLRIEAAAQLPEKYDRECSLVDEIYQVAATQISMYMDANYGSDDAAAHKALRSMITTLCMKIANIVLMNETEEERRATMELIKNISLVYTELFLKDMEDEDNE